MAETPVEAVNEAITPVPDPDEVATLRTAIGDAMRGFRDNLGDLYIFVDRDRIADALAALKTQLAYDSFVECVAVDYSAWSHSRDLEERFEVVYNLFSTARNTRVFLKIGVNDGQTVPTGKHVFLGAEYPEREINDLFGVIFAGNEQTGRFLLPDDWVGFPLRKEYPLGGEDVLFDQGDRGPAVEDLMMPHAGESFTGLTGSEEVSGR